MDTRDKLWAEILSLREQERALLDRLRLLPKPSKSDLAYWREHVKQPTYSDHKSGLARLNPHYAIQIAFAKERHNLSLFTSDRELAAQRALSIWLDLPRIAWAGVLAKRRTIPADAQMSLAELISRLEIALPKSPTRQAYLMALRRVVAQVSDLDRNGNSPLTIKAWKNQIGLITFAELTPTKLLAWRDRPRKAATTNTLIRFCRCLLSPQNLRKAKLDLQNPFATVPYLKLAKQPIPKSFNAELLFAKASQELSPAEHKAFLLGLFGGLSRKACDCAEWSWFDWNTSQIVPLPSKFFGPHTLPPVQIDPGIMAIFRKFYDQRKDDRFVVESFGFAKAKVCKSYHRIRTEMVFIGLNRWLRNNGVDRQRPFEAIAAYSHDRSVQPLRPSDLV